MGDTRERVWKIRIPITMSRHNELTAMILSKPHSPILYWWLISTAL
jgi:hypothetical protein